MEKAKIITFSAPARYAEILEKADNRSALIVEALGYYFSKENYQQGVKSIQKLPTEKKSKKPLLKSIVTFRQTLTPHNRSIDISEIIKYKNEGRN
jgi:hypothetical protein